MSKYTKAQILLAAKLGEVSMIDAKHIVSLLDAAVNKEKKTESRDFCLSKHRVQEHEVCESCRKLLGD